MKIKKEWFLLCEQTRSNPCWYWRAHLDDSIIAVGGILRQFVTEVAMFKGLFK